MSKPSESELKLMRHLWAAGRLSAREIHEASRGETGWAYSTTRKTLDRMVEKGVVTVAAVHGLKVYAPARTKLETLARMIRDFTRNVLGTDAPMPVAAFAQSKLIAPGEIKQLETLIKKLDRAEKKA
ncbi:MAG: BlaI/MecI/CopY family transcriptional regulator [Alphaproteobacteria bacterium]|nr:BlaI/MecI/CopY family transcriptional regulator [Alphaproteobacteria bacterium]